MSGKRVHVKAHTRAAPKSSKPSKPAARKRATTRTPGAKVGARKKAAGRKVKGRTTRDRKRVAASTTQVGQTSWRKLSRPRGAQAPPGWKRGAVLLWRTERGPRVGPAEPHYVDVYVYMIGPAPAFAHKHGWKQEQAAKLAKTRRWGRWSPAGLAVERFSSQEKAMANTDGRWEYP